MNIEDLIKKITPLYNRYKESSGSIHGTEALKIMWDIGELLREYFEYNDVAPHTLYRDIYGKSEGTENTERKSYITREFLGRSYRIRNIFKDKDSIDQMLPNLRRFTTFREAMPFFDNPKYTLKDGDMERLLEILNSPNSKKAMMQVRELQKKYIGIKNPRDQRLKELEEDRKIFVEFYNYIYELSQKSIEEQKNELEQLSISKQVIEHICKDTLALTEDRVSYSNEEIDSLLQDPRWDLYVKLLSSYKTESTPKKVRRLRRVIPPIKMINLSEMLHELSLQL